MSIMVTKPSFTPEEIPHGRSGSTLKGGGVWQTLLQEFLDSGIKSAKIDTGDRNFKQAYAALAHAIKVANLRDTVRAVRRNAMGSVYLQLIEPPEEPVAVEEPPAAAATPTAPVEPVVAPVATEKPLAAPEEPLVDPALQRHPAIWAANPAARDTPHVVSL